MPFIFHVLYIPVFVVVCPPSRVAFKSQTEILHCFSCPYAVVAVFNDSLYVCCNHTQFCSGLSVFIWAFFAAEAAFVICQAVVLSVGRCKFDEQNHPRELGCKKLHVWINLAVFVFRSISLSFRLVYHWLLNVLYTWGGNSIVQHYKPVVTAVINRY